MTKKQIHNTMTKSLTAPEYVQRFVQTFNDIQPARTFVRAQKHQEKAIDELDSLMQNVKQVKDRSVSLGYPEDANVLLAIEYITWSLIKELEMIIAIKENCPNNAWDDLVDAQDIASRAQSAHPSIAEKLGYDSLSTRFETYEKLLFPEQNYVSPGFDVGGMICTICGEDYTKCDHVKNRPYAGQLCHVQFEDIKPDHVALVEEPASKSHRMTGTVTGLDVMTLLPPEECNPDDAHADPDTWSSKEKEEVNSELDSIENDDGK